MQKVIVIGCPGAGKSTFSRRLRDITNLPLYYLDMLWHKPDRTNVTPEVFYRELNSILEKDAWIIDGNYNRTLELRLQNCDTVFLLDFPLEDCLAGALSRIGNEREDMPWAETELDAEFCQWILDFPQNQLPYIYELVHRYSGSKEIIIFRSREEADSYIRGMEYEGKQIR